MDIVFILFLKNYLIIYLFILCAGKGGLNRVCGDQKTMGRNPFHSVGPRGQTQIVRIEPLPTKPPHQPWIFSLKYFLVTLEPTSVV